jgi:hypothetical protein
MGAILSPETNVDTAKINLGHRARTQHVPCGRPARKPGALGGRVYVRFLVATKCVPRGLTRGPSDVGVQLLEPTRMLDYSGGTI